MRTHYIDITNVLSISDTLTSDQLCLVFVTITKNEHHRKTTEHFSKKGQDKK